MIGTGRRPGTSSDGRASPTRRSGNTIEPPTGAMAAMRSEACAASR